MSEAPSSSDSRRVTVEICEHVADVRFNRPDKHNGLDWQMIEAILGVQAELKVRVEEGSLRAIVLSGEGASFCAGLDMAAIMGDAVRVPQLLVAGANGCTSTRNTVQQLSLGWRDSGVPVIAAVQGNVFGGGLQIALGADIRLCDPEARLAILEIDWGIIPDMGISVTARGVRSDWLHELSWSGRKVGAREACEAGLVTRIVSNPREEALALARQVAGRSPNAIRAITQLYSEALMASEADALALEARLQSGLLGKAEHMECVTAKLEGRTPHFL
ncbi:MULTISPECIES: crotonase/enoyl-CoA hydratase family protein [Cobetia]|uniref:Crotonase/enoyl-CoA hydratase family protein n=1 Tax=Cobetia crustatorum TaxID=553385 RepID=A0A558HGC4_9GAMM|nr:MULTISPECIES: crotonase/enoyl-CoA hydratase family protein [Cobetia]TVU68170.1 crotonase/enoyl-CoA hydratase family protein [Cobetia crustatorum]